MAVLKRQIQNTFDEKLKAEHTARLQLETKLGCHETKFVLVTQEEPYRFRDVTVKLVRYYYMSFVTEIKSTQTNEEWLASVQFENNRLGQLNQELIDMDLKFKFEGVTFQFIGEIGDYLMETGATNRHLNMLDTLVDKILPKHADIAEFAIHDPEDVDRGLPQSRPSIQRRQPVPSAPVVVPPERLRPPTPNYVLEQNTMVSISFLSLAGLMEAVRRGDQLGFQKLPAHQTMKSQLQWCQSRRKTHLTVDDVIYLSEKNMRMHMDREEIEKAMRSGKVYMVMAGFKESVPGENAKIIIPYNLLRKQMSSDIEIPTYNSSSVNFQNEAVTDDAILCMRNNSVNYHIHFINSTPSSTNKLLLMGSYAQASSAAAGFIPRVVFCRSVFRSVFRSVCFPVCVFQCVFSSVFSSVCFPVCVFQCVFSSVCFIF